MAQKGVHYSKETRKTKENYKIQTRKLDHNEKMNMESILKIKDNIL